MEESKLDLWINPIAELLSEHARQNDHGGMIFSTASTHIDTIIAKYLSTLFVCMELTFGEM